MAIDEESAAGKVRLTQYSHGGGCGCKIAPAKLQEILQKVPLNFGGPNLLVGTATSDDAAVYKLNDSQALVLTTDFFMPIVDDARDFGRIAATNAISDVYAMGGTPILALSVLGMPINKLPTEAIQDIINGGVDICKEAGIPLAGGHSIDSPEPIFGLVVAGTVHPDKLKANSTAKAGDDLVLTKPLGVGVMTTALKGGKLGPEGYAEALATMTRLNSVGPVLADIPSVHAITDVTGFGLFGHLLEVCRGSGVRAVVDFPNLPVMEHAVPVAKLGTFPGAVKRNLESYGEYISYEESVQPLENWQKSLMADPQTSGGLLVAVDPSATDTVLQKLREDGLAHAAVIGRLVDGDVGIVVRNP